MVGSVQATDRLMKELREIYRSHSFKQGTPHSVSNTVVNLFCCDCSLLASWICDYATAATAVAHLRHRNSVCPSVCHMGGSVKNGAS